MSKPRIAIAGFGQRGKTFVELAQQETDIELVGVCDINPDRLNCFAKKHNCTAPLFTDVETMLDETKPDGVVIAVPDFQHAPVAVAAMKRGSRMIVNGTSAKGTKTKDTYSLNGFSSAYKAISNKCR